MCVFIRTRSVIEVARSLQRLVDLPNEFLTNLLIERLPTKMVRVARLSHTKEEKKKVS